MSTENSLFRDFGFKLEDFLDLFELVRGCYLECYFSVISFDGKVTFLIESFALALKRNEFYFQKDFQSLMRRRRDRVRNHCAKMKKNTPMSQKLFVLQVNSDCVTSPPLLPLNLPSRAAWCGAQSTRRPPPTGATTCSTWPAELRRRSRRSSPATPSMTSEGDITDNI